MDGGGVEPTTSGLQAARGGVNSDSIKKSAGPAPGIFLAKARGTPASIASFREMESMNEIDYLSSSHILTLPPSGSMLPETYYDWTSLAQTLLLENSVDPLCSSCAKDASTSYIRFLGCLVEAHLLSPLRN